MALMENINNNSNKESEVKSKLYELERAYGNLLNNSNTLITRYFELKKKYEVTFFKFWKKIKLIRI